MLFAGQFDLEILEVLVALRVHFIDFVDPFALEEYEDDIFHDPVGEAFQVTEPVPLLSPDEAVGTFDEEKEELEPEKVRLGFGVVEVELSEDESLLDGEEGMTQEKENSIFVE